MSYEVMHEVLRGACKRGKLWVQVSKRSLRRVLARRWSVVRTRCCCPGYYPQSVSTSGFTKALEGPDFVVISLMKKSGTECSSTPNRVFVIDFDADLYITPPRCIHILFMHPS